MAAETPSLAAARAASAAPPAGLDRPGLRTLRSPLFRTVLAFALWLLGTLVLGAVLLRQASDPAGQYAFDFAAYHAAAAELAAGRSPYAPEMLTGPIPAQGAVLYKYPPPLAQLLVPLSGLSLASAAAVWFVLQFGAAYGATWLAARAGGAARSVETFAWCGAATTFFLPVFDTLWKGNVSGFLSLALAVVLVGGAAGGLGTAAATLLKTTPAVLLVPAAFAGRRVTLGLLAAVPVLVSSIVLSPGAWLDFVRVVPNLLAGPSLFANNMAPHSQVSFALPALPMAADVTRLGAVAGGLLAIAGSVVLARRADGWPAAIVLGVAALLLLPTATWYHYLAVLLPVAAFAWPRAPRRGRWLLFAGAALVTVGLAAFPLVVVGSAIVLSASFATLRPRTA